MIELGSMRSVALLSRYPILLSLLPVCLLHMQHVQAPNVAGSHSSRPPRSLLLHGWSTCKMLCIKSNL